MNATDETPVDLAAVQADDALLDACTGAKDCPVSQHVPGCFATTRWDADVELARVLVAWRRDVDTEPVGQLVDTGDALDLIEAGVAESARRDRAQRRREVTVMVVASLAVLVFAFSVAGLLSPHSEPGDWLWPLHELLYTTDGER